MPTLLAPLNLRLLAAVGGTPGWLDVMSTSFMRHAVLAGTLVALAAGPIGYFVVVRRETFAAHALAHVGFPGATAALLVGAPVTVGLAVACVGGAVAIWSLGPRVDDRDVSTGSVLAAATALGILFASLASEGATAVSNVLFGNLLSVTVPQLVAFGVLAAAVLVVLAVIGRPMRYASIHPPVAAAGGVPVRALGLAFTVLLALVTVMAIQVVGTLLLFALVVTPAATALALSARPAVAIGLATADAIASVWAGLLLSAVFDLPPSFPIVAVSFAGWAVVTLLSRIRHERGSA